MRKTTETKVAASTDSSNDWLGFHRAAEEALANGAIEQSAEHLRAALAVAKQFNPSDPRLILSLDLLAKVYEMQKDYPRAIELIHQARSARTRLLGTFNHFVLTDLTKLAELYNLQGQPRESEQYAKLAQAIARNGFRAISVNLNPNAKPKNKASITTAPQWTPAYDDGDIGALPPAKKITAGCR